MTTSKIHIFPLKNDFTVLAQILFNVDQSIWINYGDEVVPILRHHLNYFLVIVHNTSQESK